MAEGGNRTGGDVLVVISSALVGVMCIGKSARGIVALSVARSAATDVFEIIDRIPSVDSSSQDGLKLASVKGRVRFNCVGFRYVSIARLG